MIEILLYFLIILFPCAWTVDPRRGWLPDLNNNTYNEQLNLEHHLTYGIKNHQYRSSPLFQTNS